MTAYAPTLPGEFLTNYDSLSAHMPNWIVTAAEALSTSDVLGKAYTAVRPIIDTTGGSELGNIGLPLLFTSGGTMETVTRTVAGNRPTLETLTTTDSFADQQSPVRSLSETLTVLDTIGVQQRLARAIIESIPIGIDSVAKHLFYFRGMLEQLGNDLEVSPMLLFPIPRNDVVTRVAGHSRLTPSETLHLTDVLTKRSGWVRSYTETLTTTDLTTPPTRHLAIHRALTETLAPSQTIARVLAYHRALIETLITSDALLRHLTLHRVTSETLTTNAVLAAHHSAPRSLVETLTTHDAITFEQLLQAIMGYIWVDAQGNVIYDLPDWGWVLVEDPVAGNVMNTIEVPLTTVDFTREK